MMDGSTHPNIALYAERNQLRIGKRLGFGIHGSVFKATRRDGSDVAIKYHLEAEPFYREFEIYARLDELQVKTVSGFFVPQLLAVDEDLRILEMTIVTRPFVLDFGGAYLDVKPSFTAEIWEEWEAKRREEYGERWPIVRKVLDAFEEMDIFIIDVHPSNIAFRD
jgi:hypothetical protein